ncbi:2OG-Fe(II) oxygenase family protein, partial [Candidatus Pelagibacter sp.]|nr:2OG-Fe(II) oxygenase family protein [Candidatus Pelagibacter sp.]
NEFTNDGHKKIYQSEHNLHEKKNFINISKNIENFVRKNIANIFNSKKINLIKMWFVITKQSGIINKHSHFDSDLSGVLYLKVNNNSSNSRLEIFNPFEEIDIYTFNLSLNKVEKNTFVGDKYLFSPKNNDLIIFNSYLEHSVQNKDSNISDRISLPFDLIFKI